MSKLATIGPEEFKTVAQAERQAWQELATTKRLAGWLTERMASATKRMQEHRSKAADALDSGLLSSVDIVRGYSLEKGRAEAWQDVMTALEGVSESDAPPVPESEAA